MSRESTLLAAIRAKLCRLPNVRLWRNNVGMLRDKDGRYVQYGLCAGSSDLVGFTSFVIRPEHVGMRIAALTCIECKSAIGRVSDEQKNFIRVVHAAGAFAGVARTVEQAEAICNQLQALTGTSSATTTDSQREPP